MLQSLLPCKPVMWNDLITGADHSLTKFSLSPQSSFLSPSMLSGKESMTGRDEFKSEPFTMGSTGFGVLMADPYTEEDARILSTASYFASDDVEVSEEGMPLFGTVSEGIKTDYNWDQCFGNLDDVDNLLSSGPDLTFGPPTAGSAVDSLQWYDSASPPAVQPENVTRAKSPLRSECGTVERGKIDTSNLRVEFVPGDARLAQPTLEKVQLGVKSSDYMPADERRSGPNPGAQLMASDCLQDGEAVAGNTVALRKMNGDTCVGMDISEDGAGASSVSHSDSEKASMAQVQRARRHAANRKRIEERSRRQLNHRKFIHGSTYSNSHVPTPHLLQPIPLQLTPHANHFNQPSTAAALYGFAAPRSNLSSLQPLMRPAPAYIHVGYTPSVRHIQPVPSTPGSSQVQPGVQQGMFLGYQQPGCSFQPTAMVSPHQQFQLRPPQADSPICPPPSSSSMTPQEKIEKLKYLQQMQARLAVEHQQQQFVAQGVAPMDSSLSPSLGSMPAAQLPQIIPQRQPDAPVTSTVSEMKMSAVAESDFEPSLSVGQTSLDTTSGDEGSSTEAVVLDQLQNTMKSFELETKLCIRDALYRLARSAMRRKGSGGRGGGEESGNTQVSEDGEAASDGLESSINSDPCSSSRVSRMNMNMAETQTNSIDRSIAHLLFYRTQPQQSPLAQLAPSNIVQSTQVLGNADSKPNPSTWHQAGDLQQNGWRPGVPLQALPVAGVVQGAEIGAASERHEPGDCYHAEWGAFLTDGSSQCQPRPTVEEQRPLPSPAQATSAPAPAASHKGFLDCRNGIRNPKRLEHALGLKELSQLLTDGLDVESGTLCKDETSGSSMSSHSGVREEGQGGNNQQPSRSYPSQRRIHRQGEPMRSC